MRHVLFFIIFLLFILIENAIAPDLLFKDRMGSIPNSVLWDLSFFVYPIGFLYFLHFTFEEYYPITKVKAFFISLLFGLMVSGFQCYLYVSKQSDIIPLQQLNVIVAYTSFYYSILFWIFFLIIHWKKYLQAWMCRHCQRAQINVVICQTDQL